jgi:hypothetical protein
MNMSTWKPIHEETATNILKYRDRQDELMTWLHAIKTVEAPVVKLVGGVALDHTQGMLWCREPRNEDLRNSHSAGANCNSVIIKKWTDNPRQGLMLYSTDLNSGGKQLLVTAEVLAKQAITSVTKATPAKDCITYFRDNIAAGIHTTLTTTLEEALEKLT